MSFKKLGRIFCGLAMAAAVSAAAALSGCTIETKHPRAEITIEFDGTEYVIEYTLYRNMYPQTVRHFIELAEEGFYDNTIIHNYTSTDWYGGGYAYSADDYASAISANDIEGYLNGDDDESFKAGKESEYISLFNDGKLTPTVYTDYEYDGDVLQVKESAAYRTLRGEFSNNGHTIDNGALTAEFGTLKMYYTEKAYDSDDDEAKALVYVKTSNDEVQTLYYEYNSATSLFAIQVGSSTSLPVTSYCTFAELRNDAAEDTLNDLLDAIEDYIDDNYSGDDDDFVQTASNVYIDTQDEISVPTTTSYDVPVEPIIIKTVKITRY